MKRLKWIALGIVVLIVIAITVVVMRLDGIVRYAIQTQSTASLGVPTELQSAHVSLLGGSLSLKGFEVASPKGFNANQMLALDGASVGVSVGNLRNDPLRIDKIVIDKPKLVIEQSGGKFNFLVLKESLPQKPADNSEPLKLIIEDLAVNNAQVVLRPGVPGLDQEITLPISSFNIKDIGTGEGNQNGVAIKQVVLLVVTDLAKKASESDKLPPELKSVLSLNADQIRAQVQGRIDQEIGKVQEKIGEQAGKAIEKGLGDLLGKPDQKQK